MQIVQLLLILRQALHRIHARVFSIRIQLANKRFCKDIIKLLLSDIALSSLCMVLLF
jgi:hypothetical protein